MINCILFWKVYAEFGFLSMKALWKKYNLKVLDNQHAYSKTNSESRNSSSII